MEIHKMPFYKKKKISIDMEEGMLKIIDRLAKLAHTNRSTIIISLFDFGIYPFFKQLESSWRILMVSDPEKKERIEGLLKELKKIEVESGIHQARLIGMDDMNAGKMSKEKKEKIKKMMKDIEDLNK